MFDISVMTLPELEEHLARLREDLEDVEEERAFVLGQTGLHVSAREVNRFEAMIDELQRKIAEVEAAIASHE